MSLAKRMTQFLEYLVGGASYFWSGYIIFAICYSGLHWNWLEAKLLGDVVGWTLSYLIQRYWAFASPSLSHDEGSTVAKYTLLTVINLGIDYGIIWSLQSVGISPYIGFFISASFFAVWNYLWYRFWVFYGKSGGDAKEAAV
ncbi:MAG TPA: GtrA family protein [Patescibacteria group bacterium]|nr:GtrA family protein [Patescibacteria group bacterium]